MHLICLTCSVACSSKPSSELAQLGAERPWARQMEGAVLWSQSLATMLEFSGSQEPLPVEQNHAGRLLPPGFVMYFK